MCKTTESLIVDNDDPVFAISRALKDKTTSNDKTSDWGKAAGNVVFSATDNGEAKPVEATYADPSNRSGSKTEEEDEEDQEDQAKLSAEEMEAISQCISPNPVLSEREQLERIKNALVNEEKHTPFAEKIIAEVEYAVASSDPSSPKAAAIREAVAEKVAEIRENAKREERLMSSEEADSVAKEAIEKADTNAKQEADESTTSDLGAAESSKEAVPETASNKTDKKLDDTMARLKKKVESMVGRIELQLSDVEAKIGDKMHFLDKDMDGVLSREEMAQSLQLVLRRELTFDEAMAIASDMVRVEVLNVLCCNLSRFNLI